MYEKIVANLEEIKARGGPVIAIVGEGDTEAATIANDVIEVPAIDDFLQPIVSIVPLQLLAYHIALLRGCRRGQAAQSGQECLLWSELDVGEPKLPASG